MPAQLTREQINMMSEFDFNAFVKTLSIEELANLVIRFAPETFREEVKNQHLNIEQARKTFDQNVNSIRALFKDEDLLNDPIHFDTSLTGWAERLSGLWDRFPEETGQIFLFCIKKIKEIQSEGLLYHHWPEKEYNGHSFLEVIQRYAKSLPFDMKRVFIDSLEILLELPGSGSFFGYPRELDQIFVDSEKDLLKQWFLKSVKSEEKSFHKHYYFLLRDNLSLEEKAFVLEKIYHQETSLCLDLVDTLDKLKMPDTAIDYLEELKKFNKNPWFFTQELFLKLIELKKSVDLPYYEDLVSGINTYKTNTFLEKCIDFFPEKNLELEAISKTASHHFYLKYLISKNRLDEAHQLVLTSKNLDDQSILSFFREYCEKYPGDATNYFVRWIDRELIYAGDRHYELIVNLLQYLFKISPSKAVELVSMIKRDYKRRRNLVSMLDQKF